jgi:hypothetical protein
MKVAIGNLEWIAARSLRNCHCVGLDSIMFNDKPEQRVRVFVAQEGHQLWRNEFPFRHKMAVGLHPHHCNVELRPIFGTIWNVVRRPGGAPVQLDCFTYISPIKQEPPSSVPVTAGVREVAKGMGSRRIAAAVPAPPQMGSFKRVYRGAHFLLMMEQLSGPPLAPMSIRTAMPAQAIHTIYVPKGERAAWFVFEGKEDREYQPMCWSNDDLEKFDFDTINQPMSVPYLETLLDSIPELGATAGRLG